MSTEISDTLEKRLAAQIVASMKAHTALRTETLRMMKSALKMKSIEKIAELTEAESQQVLATMIKQRRDSFEQFTKGGREELAAKEAAEILLIEEFMPKSLSEEDLTAIVAGVVAELTAERGTKPGPKEMGTIIKATQAKIATTGARAEGRIVSEIVKKALV
jgi:hypothetical protein